MNCRTCGTFLAEGMHICPQCGTSAAHPPYDSGSDDPTAPASYMRPQIPPAHYGSVPYISSPPPPSQYSNSEPYEAPHLSSYPTQPPPNSVKKGPNIVLMVSMVLLLTVLIGGGLIFLSHQQFGGQTMYRATMTAAPTATPDLTKNPYPPGTGTLMINDPMQDNSKGYQWLELTTPLNGGGIDSCGFNNGAYHDTLSQGGSQVCRADALYISTLANIAYEAQLTIMQGASCGLAFRINSAQKTGYIFVVGVTGDYTIDTYNFKAGNNNFTVLSKGYSSAIKRGLNQTNVVAVVANGTTISAYVNNQLVDQIQDSTYRQGKIGIYGDGSNGADIEAKGVRLWSF